MSINTSSSRPKLSQDDLMAKFEVLYAERHGGTFNGCLETLHLSLESFIKDKVREIVGPALDPNNRMMLGTCFSFLCGQSKNFPMIRGTQVQLERIAGPPGGIFTADGEAFLDDLIEERNGHTHVAPNYSVVAKFRNIKIDLGKYLFVFDPTAPQNVLILERDYLYRDGVHMMHVRTKDANDTIDMDLCEQTHADLILECLTRKEFTEEHPNVTFGTGTHAFVIYYGTKTFFAFITRKEYEFLHDCFGYDSGKKWKTHYFKFRAASILVRLLANHRTPQL